MCPPPKTTPTPPPLSNSTPTLTTPFSPCTLHLAPNLRHTPFQPQKETKTAQYARRQIHGNV
ncbi:predicted protein [Plenodomus lingam JN3]|uniref:Predicted protein n=1 Tax=Leptosphaeria maculans (strain JN3 / isolate v23.1.3 / race Av1-4-5-6-7-8) TaxID=985895 RepID=E4ZHL9_LEPMJ|nr:predicted protein [Plenodomus lingam JN3]CBX90852.1 predicted protein [Plenodomus lingam JN3]